MSSSHELRALLRLTAHLVGLSKNLSRALLSLNVLSHLFNKLEQYILLPSVEEVPEATFLVRDILHFMA